MYEVPTKTLNQSFKRNIERFPGDFAFQLSRVELENWRSQIVTSNPSAKMALRRAPFAFTQEGVAMLSSVLRSERAIRMNIEIMRAFVRVRELMVVHKDVAARMEKLERSQQRTISVIEVLAEDIDRLGQKLEHIKPRDPPYSRHRIGYVTDTEQG